VQKHPNPPGINSDVVSISNNPRYDFGLLRVLYPLKEVLKIIPVKHPSNMGINEY
jgi:hypothetical protein